MPMNGTTALELSAAAVGLIHGNHNVMVALESRRGAHLLDCAVAHDGLRNARVTMLVFKATG